MRYEIRRETLVIYFEGEINSFNADNVEQEAREILDKEEFKALVLDFASVRYISSAGLRIVLKFKQQYKEVSIEECSLEVYDILSMTGFTNMLPVKKALKRLYVSGAKVIGEGFFSTVYRIDKDTIVKVFNRTSDPDQIERELAMSKQAFVLGIPTAISYDIVRVDDKLGVRFEMLDCMSLKNAFLEYPDKYDELVDKYVALLKKINTTDTNNNPVFPDMREFFFEKLSYIKHFVDHEHYEKMKALLSQIPTRSTFVHGDCHFKNIMVQGDEFLLIDMDTLSKGHPIFELALIRAPYVAFEADAPGNSEKFLGVSAAFAEKLYNDLVERYFGTNRQTIKDTLEIICSIHMLYWNVINTPDNEARMKGNKERLYALLDKYDELDLGE
jgi:uncharacterized protein (TIGR02172 family)